MANRWAEEEKETLYFLARKNANKVINHKAVDASTDIIKHLHNAFNASYVDIPEFLYRDVSAILYKLEGMNFLGTYKDSHQTECFKVNSLKKSDFLNFKVAPDYKKLTNTQQVNFDSSYKEAVLQTCDIKELCLLMSDLLGLSTFRIGKELFDLKLIRVNTLMQYELVSPLVEKEKDEHLKNKELSSEHKNRINNLRNDISYIYDTHSKDNPSITYSSDGTGTGKSYSVINSFIQQTDVADIANGHRNLLFITPQKAQIDIDSGLLDEAKKKGIHTLSFLSQGKNGDMSNIEFKSWVTKEKNIDVFKRWVKVLKNDNFYKESIFQLNKGIGDSEYYNREIPKARYRGEYEIVEEYEERKKNNDIKIVKTLFKLAEGILQEQKSGKYIPIQERFNEAGFNKTGKPNKAYILSEIIDFVLPFERAKYTSCILLATSAKFDYNVNIVINNKSNGRPVIKSLPFDYIMGQKKKIDNSDDEVKTADVNGKPFSEQIDFLKTKYFITDESNYFYQNNILFTLIVDEEHDAYDKFFESSETKLFDVNTQIAHVFSVINRIVQSFKSADPKDKDNFVLYEAHEQFVSELEHLFNIKCDISEAVTLDKILAIFSNNLNHIVIDSSELEQIIQICKNVFSITPKRFFNEEGLRKIRIGSYANYTECRIYYEKQGKIDTNPTMHDILQALMCVFAACSHIKDKDFRSMIRHGAENSQNALLDKFITKAVSARYSVDAMFDRVDKEDLYIDEFFTYFTPKVVFSIEKVNDLPFRSLQLKDKVYVTFRLDLFEALPEVTLMRILHNTQNSVICLSATSGFKYSYSGNYCRPMMKRYGDDTKNNLNYRSIARTDDDAKKLQQLRECRAEARNVSIKEFVNTESNWITEARNNPEFSKTYSGWLKSLREHLKYSNPYQRDALERQVEAMLLAAFDKKNSLILSLNNKFSEVIRGYIKSENGKREKGRKVLDEEDYKVFEIKPFDNGITLRIILFDADLVKKQNIEDYLKLQNQNVKIALISSYNSAGTGLNLVTHYENENIDEDFERLVLINSPFYSKIKTDTGLNSIRNYVLLLKHYADENQSRQLKDFDVNLVSGMNYKILMQEHVMSILKNIMQAVGRVERRDTNMETEIFLPNDVIDDLALQFSRLKKEGNELIFQSMSLLNYELKKHCLEKADRHSFKSDEKREIFSAQVSEMGQAIDKDFFDNYLNCRLDEARLGDKTAIELNEALRSEDCIINPQRYIDRLLNLAEIKEDTYYQQVISSFYLNSDEIKNIMLCTKEHNEKTLTDLTEGDRLYKPYEWVLPKYHKSVYHKLSTAADILKYVYSLEKQVSKEILPHPAMLPLFKGNIGEYMFSQCLKSINITSLTVDEVINLLEPTVYELFDFYIKIGEKVFCVDVKNWSALFDKQELAKKTHEKALVKRTTLNHITAKNNLSAEFIYVNTHQDRNAINPKQEFDKGSTIYYLNLFQVITQYESVEKEKPNPKKQSTLKERLNINPSLIKLLGGNLNG